MTRDWRTLTHEEFKQLENDGMLKMFDINDPNSLMFLFEFNRQNRQKSIEAQIQVQIQTTD